jgi:hypothetical protein
MPDKRCQLNRSIPFGCARSKPSQGSGPASLTLAGDFSFCFQCQTGSSLVLRRPIEITALIGQMDSRARAPDRNAAEGDDQ